MTEGLRLAAGQTASTTLFLEAGSTARWRFEVAGAPSDDVSYTIVLRRLGRATATEEVVVVPKTWHSAEEDMCVGNWTNRNSCEEDVVLAITWSNEHSWFKDKTIYFDVGRQRAATTCAELAEESRTPRRERAEVPTATKVMPLPAPSLQVPTAASDALRVRVGALESLLERLQRPAAVADEAWLDGAAVEANSDAAAEATAKGVSELRQIAVQCSAPAALPMPRMTLRVITPVIEPRAFRR